MTPDFERAAALRAAVREFSHRSEQIIRPHGLPLEQYQLLLLLHVQPGEKATIGSLHRQLHRGQSAVTQLARRMENRGLITRELSKDDARIRFLKLTPRGESSSRKRSSHSRANARGCWNSSKAWTEQTLGDRPTPGTRTRAQGLSRAHAGRPGATAGVAATVASSASPLAVRAVQLGPVALSLAIGAAAGGGGSRFSLPDPRLHLSLHRPSGLQRRGPVVHGFERSIGWWFVLVAPVVGGLLYGCWSAASPAKPVATACPRSCWPSRNGRADPPAVAASKSLASALCIGSGGSVGREGPIVQIGSALGSTLGQTARCPSPGSALLVACGAAGGISATFNAPIAGMFFALELILPDFASGLLRRRRPLAFVADSSVEPLSDRQPFLHLPTFQLHSSGVLPVRTASGSSPPSLALRSSVSLRHARISPTGSGEDRNGCDPGRRRLLLGGLLLALPEIYGVGYPPSGEGRRRTLCSWFLLILLVGKIVATSLTIAIGGSGGVFAPSLFMGAMLGTPSASAAPPAPRLDRPAGSLRPGRHGRGVRRRRPRPLTAVIIIFELTGEYQSSCR